MRRLTSSLIDDFHPVVERIDQRIAVVEELVPVKPEREIPEEVLH